MDDDLAAFLGPLTPFAEEIVTWPTGTMRLACYLTDRTPPRRYVTSARAVVTDGDRVLVVHDPINNHIMPGGRLEANETPEDALRREVLEETGWSLAWFRPIGILHFNYIDPLPEGWSYPHPDFLQIVYAGSPGEYHPELKEVDEYVLGSEFVEVSSARRLPLNAGQQVFLDTALGQSLRVVAGIQAPAGTLEPGESPDDGVVREARLLPGLDSLKIRRFLGSRDYDMSSYGRAELHRRYYYHFECTDDAPSVWRHFETDPRGGPSQRIEFELYWVMLPD